MGKTIGLSPEDIAILTNALNEFIDSWICTHGVSHEEREGNISKAEVLQKRLKQIL